MALFANNEAQLTNVVDVFGFGGLVKETLQYLIVGYGPTFWSKQRNSRSLTMEYSRCALPMEAMDPWLNVVHDQQRIWVGTS